MGPESGFVCVYTMNGTACFAGIVYQIKQVTLSDGSCVYPLWVSRDPEDPGEGGRSYANLTFASSFNSTYNQSMLLQDQSLGAVSTNTSTVFRSSYMSTVIIERFGFTYT